MMEWTSSFTKKLEIRQLRYFIENVKYRTLIWASIWASIELSRQKIMFNFFTYVIYITFNLSLFIIYFFIFYFNFFFSCIQCIEWLYFSGNNRRETQQDRI